MQAQQESPAIQIHITDSGFVYISQGDLLGLGIEKRTTGNISLGEPQKLATNMMHATNISDSIYKIGMATASPPDSGEQILFIPITGDTGSVTFLLSINGIKYTEVLQYPVISEYIFGQDTLFLPENEQTKLTMPDITAASFRYTWFRDDSLLTSVREHELTLSHDSTTEKHIYNCLINSVLFSNFRLSSGKVTILYKDPPSNPEPVFIPGDINMDKLCSVYDAELILKYNLGYDFPEDEIKLPINDTLFSYVDINNDNTLDVLDAAFIYQYVSGNIDSLDQAAKSSLDNPHIKASIHNDTIVFTTEDNLTALSLKVTLPQGTEITKILTSKESLFYSVHTDGKFSLDIAWTDDKNEGIPFVQLLFTGKAEKFTFDVLANGYPQTIDSHNDNTYCPELSSPDKWKVYPNPAFDQVFFDVSLEKVTDLAISLTDIPGKEYIVFKGKGLAQGKHQISYNVLKNLQPGIYIYRVISDNREKIGKIYMK
jgi:hypothetical protein